MDLLRKVVFEKYHFTFFAIIFLKNSNVKFWNFSRKRFYDFSKNL
jgi:hypothetical protein